MKWNDCFAERSEVDRMGRKFYNFLWTIIQPFYGLFYPREVSGLENLPKNGGFILCANHFSNHDPLYISSCIPKAQQVHFLAKKELFEHQPLKTFVTWLGAIPVDRGHTDLSAMRAALKVVKEGGSLGIFPQGTRSPENIPTPMLNGASLIALRGGVPVIPAYVDGPFKLFHKTAVRFGRPIDLGSYNRRCDSNTLTEVTHAIENSIWELKDPKKMLL